MSLINDNWKCIFDKYKIEQEIAKNGLFYITADEIREFKEPRLMTKFDTRESLPSVFNNRYSILPVTRGRYVIGEFELYEDLPEQKSKIKRIEIPDYYETIDINHITSEAVAINVMGITPILEDFLQEADLVQTISGRMGSGNFDFFVNKINRQSASFVTSTRADHTMHRIEVRNSQVEIDGGFESPDLFTIIEGKNVVHSNFLVRQLYYPYRLWRSKIRKTIRPLFMVYSNNIFRLLEYEFTDDNSYSSIRLVKEKNYSLEDVKITSEDLLEVWRNTKIKPEPEVTFVQADSFDKVISLIENLSEHPMTKAEIADLFGFQDRQSDYYSNACKYLGLIEKRREDGIRRIYLADKGRELLKMSYRRRQLEYAKLILQHRIFNEIFEIAIKYNEIPDKNYIAGRMQELNLCSSSLISRRVSSVTGWIRWILRLTASI